MGLNYEMALYTELTGEDGTKVPIGQLGHFLWGYEIGVEKGRPKGKWKQGFSHKCVCSRCEQGTDIESDYCAWCGADMRGEE